jgi:hypothetical protein
MKRVLLITTLITSTLIFAQVPTNGLISYFNFENTLNSNSPTHSFTNGTTTNITYNTGYYGQGVSYTGAETLVNSTISSAITSQAKYTITWWEFRPIGVPTNYSTSFELGETNYYRATNSSGCYAPTYYPNRYEFGLLDGPAYRCLTLQEQATLAGSWVHHAVVHNGTSVSYYLNGALSINTWLLNYSGLNLATNKFTFGGGTNGGVINTAKCMNGKLDELYVYNRELSAAEILAVKNSSVGILQTPVISNVASLFISSSATVSYTINASGLATTSVIKYGNSSTALTNQVTGGNASGNSNTNLSTSISGLSSSNTYYYQIEATNADGTTVSPIYTLSYNLIQKFPFDNSLNNENNTISLSPLSTSPTFVDNRFSQPNKAVFINNQQMNASISNLPQGNAQRTVSFWMKRVTDQNHLVFAWGTPATNQAYGMLINAGSGNLNYYGWGNDFVITGLGHNSSWSHYVLTFNGTSASAYKDGTLLGTSSRAWNSTGTNLIFGNYAGGSSASSISLNAHIDDFEIYNIALSSSEVMALYNNQSVLSNQDFNSNNLKATIYPNPTSDNFSIEMENEVKSVEIYSLQGHKVMTASSKEINVSILSKGIYLIRIEDSNNAIATQKLIIK